MRNRGPGMSSNQFFQDRDSLIEISILRISQSEREVMVKRIWFQDNSLLEIVDRSGESPFCHQGPPQVVKGMDRSGIDCQYLLEFFCRLPRLSKLQKRRGERIA